MIGLVDPSTLAYDPDRSGSHGSRSAPGRGVVGGRSAPGRAGPEAAKAQANGHERLPDADDGPERADPGPGDGAVVVAARAG